MVALWLGFLYKHLFMNLLNPVPFNGTSGIGVSLNASCKGLARLKHGLPLPTSQTNFPKDQTSDAYEYLKPRIISGAAANSVLAVLVSLQKTS